jgi:hypothetical protein
MGKAWIKKAAEGLGLTVEELRGLPGVDSHITERKVGPNMGYMISDEGVELARVRMVARSRIMNPAYPNLKVKAKIVKRPKNRRLLVCRLEGDGMPLAEGSEQREAMVRVRNNQSWSVGQVIELGVVDSEGMWSLTHKWNQWEKRIG